MRQMQDKILKLEGQLGESFGLKKPRLEMEQDSFDRDHAQFQRINEDKDQVILQLQQQVNDLLAS